MNRITLKQHNEETYDNLIRMLKEENRVACVQPTGTGKSYIALAFIENHPNQKILLMAPTDIILNQFNETVEAIFHQDPKEAILKNTTSCKYLDLGLDGFKEILNEEWDVIIMDEFHRVGAVTWNRFVDVLLKKNPNAKIIGLSATPIRYLDDGRNMGEEIFHENYACHYNLNDAWKKGILPIPKYVLTDYRITEGTKDYIKKRYPYAKSEEQIKHIVKTFLENGGNIHHILKNNLPNKQGKYIVFCSDAAHIHKMRPVVKNWLLPFNSSIHIYTSLAKDDVQDEELLAFKNDNSEAIKLLFCVERLNEGLHLTNLDGEFMLRPTISPIIYMQQMGRVLNAGSKSKPVIFDLVNNFSEYRNTILRFNEMSEEEVDNLNPTERKEYESYREGRYDQFLEFDFVQNISEICDLFDELDINVWEQQWNDMFFLLCEYLDEMNDFPDYFTVYKGKNLGEWCTTQNKRYRKGKLSKSQLSKLKSIGFPFKETRFTKNEIFELLLEFIQKYKREPKKDEKYKDARIGYFLSKIRSKYKEGELEDEWIHKFSEAGIPLNNKRDNTHKKIISLIREYLSIYNELPIARDIVYKGEHLGKRINDIRNMYKKGYKIKDKFIDEYIKLGVLDDFTLSGMSQIDYNIELLNLYKKEFNQLPTTKSRKYKNRNIYTILANIRFRYAKGKLNEYQISKLNRIDLRILNNLSQKEQADIRWNNQYLVFEKFYQKFGRLPIRKTDYNYQKNREWVYRQKKSYKKGVLSKERQEKLESIGVVFKKDKHE